MTNTNDKINVTPELKAKLRRTTERHFLDEIEGHPIFVRFKDLAVSCAYKNAICPCAIKKKWFTSDACRKSLGRQHGIGVKNEQKTV